MSSFSHTADNPHDFPSPDSGHNGPSSLPSGPASGSTSDPRGDSTDTRPTTAHSHTSQKQSIADMDDNDVGVQRSASRASTAAGDGGVSRSNTLKKRASVSRKSSLRRSASGRSLRKAGSIKGFSTSDDPEDDYNSAFHTPIPTQSAPTDILANRFQSWRAFLKSLITYFREVQVSYETRAKAIMKVSNVVSNTQMPTVFMSDGGLSEATRILNDYHKHALTEANKARDIEQDVIGALNGLRADLGAKIKEIKNLHGDFKNSVEKEKEGTKRAIVAYQESLQHYEHADGLDKGRADPFIVRLNVDRMVEKQIDEENYLHRAYLNLESSGRELETIVVGEIQKAYNALAGIVKREGDDAYHAVELLRSGPISMQKDLEWMQFVHNDPHLVKPELPLRRVQDIDYPGKDHPAAAEIRAGMLERKSKYLKSYTPGWYVLSPTHLHEFKSADNIYSQPPVMSLYLGDQKLGSHSGPESSSHKFMLKGRQSGGMHRGHSWVFRAETYDTMMAWFDAIKSLTEKTGAEKTEYVRKHARSISGNSARAMSITSSDGLEDDEADHEPYSASIAGQQANQPAAETRPQRPQPGGRFPSDLAIPRARSGTAAGYSDYSSEPEQEPVHQSLPAAVIATREDHSHLRPQTPPNQDLSSYSGYETNPYALQGVATHESSPAQLPRKERVASDAPMLVSQQSSGPSASHPLATSSSPPAIGAYDGTRESRFKEELRPQSTVVPTQTFVLPLHAEPSTRQIQPADSSDAASQIVSPVSQTSLQQGHNLPSEPDRPQSSYGDWLGPTAVGAGAGVGAAALAHEAHPAHPAQTAPQRPEPISRFSMSTQQTNFTNDTDMTETPRTQVFGNVNGATFEDKVAPPPLDRQRTEMSVSALHVPGEFPKTITNTTPASLV